MSFTNISMHVNFDNIWRYFIFIADKVVIVYIEFFINLLCRTLWTFLLGIIVLFLPTRSTLYFNPTHKSNKFVTLVLKEFVIIVYIIYSDHKNLQRLSLQNINQNGCQQKVITTMLKIILLKEVYILKGISNKWSEHIAHIHVIFCYFFVFLTQKIYQGTQATYLLNFT